MRFTTCDDYLNVCLGRPAKDRSKIANPTNGKYFCGPFRLVSEVPAKWTYRREVPNRIRVVEYADINVTCKG
ncbi:hypothetical protein LK09_16940 [Microbacterium mangrovi]|uniref:Uncharacterized protein n=1 Tax=Microbacterium mangrovi TaxID=1348253 RepID=A0A0B1ZZ67_9MICO|nr:hypothetical protein LK09_16940 [Microbacterium mangrovi]